MKKETLEAIVVALQEGCTPVLPVEEFACFSEEATAGDAHKGPETLQAIAATLTPADIPTFQRAIRAIDEGDLAWLGFKVVFDPQAAVANVDNEVTKKYGQQGSADGQPLVFFCNDAKEIVASRPYSPRDTFQMKDVTRGPSMHNDQFDGLTWASEPLFGKVRVWLLGASDAAVEVAALANHVGFHVIAVDYDPAFLSPERFPEAERILLHGGNFTELANMPARPGRLCVRAHPRAHVRPRSLRLGLPERCALRGHDGLLGQERPGARAGAGRGRERSGLAAGEAAHRAEVRRQNPGRAGHRHRGRTGGRALPAALQPRGARFARRPLGPITARNGSSTALSPSCGSAAFLPIGHAVCPLFGAYLQVCAILLPSTLSTPK